MLKIKVTYKEEDIESITFLGHALYDDYGKDIVCAAASSILITTVNGILSFDSASLEVSQEKDKVVVLVKKNDEVTKTLLQNMLRLLQDLEKNYPSNLKLS